MNDREQEFEAEALRINAGRKPTFGDRMRNPWASENNPTRDGYFVKHKQNTPRSGGPTYEFTDGHGKFWETSTKYAFFIDAARATPAQPQPSPASVSAAILALPLPKPVEEVQAWFRGEWDYTRVNGNYYTASQIARLLSEAAALAEKSLATETKALVPEGWKLVPIEPTEAMIHAAEDVESPRPFGKVYRAMLASAPVAEQVQGQQPIPDSLRRIGELLRTQDNRYTDQPLFLVEQKRVIVGIDPDYLDQDQIGWFDADGKAAPEEYERLEARWQDDGHVPDGWTRTGFSEQWEFVTACFTEQGCKDYIAKDGHNLKEPRIYADGSYRNEEYRAIRNWLMSLAAPSIAQDGQKSETDHG